MHIYYAIYYYVLAEVHFIVLRAIIKSFVTHNPYV